jgi:hypothetical protein
MQEGEPLFESGRQEHQTRLHNINIFILVQGRKLNQASYHGGKDLTSNDKTLIYALPYSNKSNHQLSLEIHARFC